MKRLLLPAALLLAGGCGGDAAPPADFQVVFGAGGGITGESGGGRLAADGSVYSWREQPGEPVHEERLGTLAPGERAALWAEVRASGLLETVPEGVGNWTSYLEITAGGRVIRASWANPNHAAARKAARVFDNCARLLTYAATRQARQSKTGPPTAPY